MLNTEECLAFTTPERYEVEQNAKNIALTLVAYDLHIAH